MTLPRYGPLGVPPSTDPPFLKTSPTNLIRHDMKGLVSRTAETGKIWRATAKKQGYNNGS